MINYNFETGFLKGNTGTENTRKYRQNTAAKHTDTIPINCQAKIISTVSQFLRRSIDHELARSRFGVVVLSEAFFQKHWPHLELDGLVAREAAGMKVILPVWHGVDADHVRLHSPLLAARLAVSSANGLENVVTQLMQAIQVAPRSIVA